MRPAHAYPCKLSDGYRLISRYGSGCLSWVWGKYRLVARFKEACKIGAYSIGRTGFDWHGVLFPSADRGKIPGGIETCGGVHSFGSRGCPGPFSYAKITRDRRKQTGEIHR